MNTSPAGNRNMEFDFSQEDFDAICNIVTPQTGILLPDSKKMLVYSRLTKRLRALDMPSFKAYIDYVNQKIRANDNTELNEIINAVTTNVTSFFRENHHFDILKEQLPDLLKQFGNVNIWSAGCSSGEEPWSLAMTVKSFMLTHPTAQIGIHATDLDSNVVNKARTGIYELPEADIEKHPQLKKYMEDDSSQTIRPLLSTNKVCRVKDEIRPLVTFGQINLLHDWKLPKLHYPVIFCRNVMIYFSKDTQRELVAKFEKVMPKGGLLCIGHSESLVNVSDNFERVGQTAYRKTV